MGLSAVLLFFLCMAQISKQQTLIGLGCPTEWLLHEGQCYRFYFHDPLVYEEAASACWVQGSALVSVNTLSEHQYISQYLTRHGKQSAGVWWTSGILRDGVVKWNGDGTNSSLPSETYWTNPPDQSEEYSNIAYKYSTETNSFGWAAMSASSPLYYICEIPQTEMSRVIHQNRDFVKGLSIGPDYRVIEKVTSHFRGIVTSPGKKKKGHKKENNGFGSNETVPSHYPRGPQFIVQPNHTIVIETYTVTLDCEATGNPQPEFTWYEMTSAYRDPQMHHQNTYQKIIPSTDSRYTFTNGRLTIQRPRETPDAGTYQCQASNIFGSILSEPMDLTFGYLNDFSPNPQGYVTALLNQGVSINCNPPSYKPGLTYQWLKDVDINGTIANVMTKINVESNFVRPDLKPYTFVSYSGALYFTEVQFTDGGMFYCVVTLAASAGSRLSTLQPPMRASTGVELRILGTPSSEYGPIIHSDFIAVFPKPPMVGYDIRLECNAYGKMPLEYSWTREDKPFPKGTTFDLNDRVLNIPNAKFEDGGTYTCTVIKTSGTQNTDSRSFVLTLEAKPYFIFPLRNMHADVGSSLTWRCEARAVPKAIYSWFKNSKLLSAIPGEIEIHENVLFIRSLDIERDAGMYQCAASNTHGTTITSAQLRVLFIAPNFYKHSLPPQTVSATGGNMTLKCQPEAAPTPEITWTQNGQPISSDDRRTVFLDGTLHIPQMTVSDQGRYTCKASNVYGESESSTYVSVFGAVRFTTTPLDAVGEVNRTSFLYCHASYDYTKYDLVYVWKFNGRVIDGQNDPFYRQDNRDGLNGLYIVNAQYYHTGKYECMAQTVFSTISASATLIIRGSPGEPAGLYVESNSIQGTSLKLVWTWTPAMGHGFPVLFFRVEAYTEFDRTWEIVSEDISESATSIPNSDKRYFEVTGLLPNNGYTFRVTAINVVGVGTPSRPKGVYRIPAGPPTKAPTNVDGGGGTVGVLTITWEPLKRSEEGGKGFGYKVFWRLANETNTKWFEKMVGNETTYTHTIGEDNYYLLYEVAVQAYNSYDGSGLIFYGPQSAVAYVYSAEGMPVQRPRNVRYEIINATSLLVSWDQIPSTREAMKGKVLGYEIDWLQDGGGDSGALYVYCTCGQGVIVGLQPDTFYWLNLFVFNSAGASSPSEGYLAKTYEFPPRRYPTFVNVYSHGSHSARVEWRGVNIEFGEASLDGYKIFWWPVGDDIRTTNVTIVPKQTWGIINGLQTDVIYNLRVLAINRGGNGKTSPTVYFTLLKDGAVNFNAANFDPSTSEFLLAGSGASKILVLNHISWCIAVLFFVVYVYLYEPVWSGVFL